jgi:hypothetical protein
VIAHIGRACDGFEPVPAGMCHIGNAAFAVEFVGGTPAGLGLLLFAPEVATKPLPLPNDCGLYLEATGVSVMALLPLSPLGGARVPLPIPAAPALMGTWVFLQMVSVDPAQPMSPRGSRALGLFLAD